MITYRASLDVPRDTVVFLARLLTAHRRAVSTRRGRRALTPFAQAVMALRWFRDRARVTALAHDHRISSATVYRYLHEAITILAAQAPDLREELVAAKTTGAEVVLLDGTLVDTDRVTDATGPDRWYSGEHKRHGGNIQVLADTAGRPLWTSPVEPGSTHDLAAARAHVLPALYWAASTAGLGLATLADKAYTWTGTGIRTPYPRRPGVPHDAIHSATLGWNTYVNTVRAAVERAIATLKVRWAALRRITLNPWRIGHNTAAALVLHRHEHAYRERLSAPGGEGDRGAPG